MMDVRVAAYDAGAPPPKLSFGRWRGRECLRIDWDGDVLFYDGLLAWRASDDGQSRPLEGFFNRAEVDPKQGDAARSRLEDSGQRDAPEPESPAFGGPECSSSEPGDTEPLVPDEEEEVGLAPGW